VINVRLRTTTLRESRDKLVGDEHFCPRVSHLYELTQVGRQLVGVVVGRCRFEFLSLAGHHRRGPEAIFQKHHISPPIFRPFGNVIAAPETMLDGNPGGISILGLGKEGYVVKSIMIRVIREWIVLGTPAKGSDLCHRIVSHEDYRPGRVGGILRWGIAVAPRPLALVIEKAGGFSVFMEVAHIVKILGFV